MEKLESWYQDRGFVEFRPISTQVSVAPDKRSVYVTINVKEGERYTVGDVSLIGDLSRTSNPSLSRACSSCARGSSSPVPS